MNGRRFPSVLEQAKMLLGERLSAGSVAVDATVGNGHDTLFLAECVGPTGHVYGFDIQAQAIAAATARLSEAGMLARVTLLHAGHEQWEELLPAGLRRRIQAVTFNLGYLPGGDKSVITRPETTVRAMAAAFDWLAPGGILTAVLYSGHPGGRQEAEQVLAWARELDQKTAQVLWYQFLNQKNQPPTLLAVFKLC